MTAHELLRQEYPVKLFLLQTKQGGTVFLDAKEISEGKMQTCHLVVQVLIICLFRPPSDFFCFPFLTHRHTRWGGPLPECPASRFLHSSSSFHQQETLAAETLVSAQYLSSRESSGLSSKKRKYDEGLFFLLLGSDDSL